MELMNPCSKHHKPSSKRHFNCETNLPKRSEFAAASCTHDVRRVMQSTDELGGTNAELVLDLDATSATLTQGCSRSREPAPVLHDLTREPISNDKDGPNGGSREPLWLAARTPGDGLW